MNEAEAIEWQKSFNKTYKGFPNGVDVACDLAIQALEKQIPKKVVRIKLRPSEWGSEYRCPICESELIPTEFFTADGTEPDEKITWCPGCGQKLDWSDNDAVD